MIARVWRGEVAAARADRYYDYLLETGVAECRKTPGNAGVTIWRRAQGETVEFVFTSFWPSMEAVRGFAGAEVEQAVYYPADRDFLVELDPCVRHYEVALASTPTAAGSPSIGSPSSGQSAPAQTGGGQSRAEAGK